MENLERNSHSHLGLGTRNQQAEWGSAPKCLLRERVPKYSRSCFSGGREVRRTQWLPRETHMATGANSTMRLSDSWHKLCGRWQRPAPYFSVGPLPLSPQLLFWAAAMVSYDGSLAVSVGS